MFVYLSFVCVKNFFCKQWSCLPMCARSCSTYLTLPLLDLHHRRSSSLSPLHTCHALGHGWHAYMYIYTFVEMFPYYPHMIFVNIFLTWLKIQLCIHYSVFIRSKRLSNPFFNVLHIRPVLRAMYNAISMKITTFGWARTPVELVDCSLTISLSCLTNK